MMAAYSPYPFFIVFSMPSDPSSYRTKKRLFVVSVYIVLFVLIGWWVYKASRPAPTCTDGAKNQNQTGIDCGGVCGACAPTFASAVDLKIKSTSLVYGGVNSYDVVAQIFNPNAEDGAQSFDYVFTLKDDRDAVLVERHGTEFILPGETKYITETQLESPTVPKKISFVVSNQVWKHFVGGYQEKPTINVYSKNYNQITSGVGFGEATGLVVNESAFDFVNIKVKAILFDANDKPIAVNSTELQTVKAGERRDFRLVWPTAFPGAVMRMEAEAETNVYKDDNFVKKYFPNSKF